MRLLLLCRSLTYAQRSARALERAGITGTIQKMPRAEGVRGCAYGVLINQIARRRAMEVLEAAGLTPERIYVRAADGSIREAEDDDLA